MDDTLWQLTVECGADGEDVVAALLEKHFSSSPSIYTDAETQRRAVTVYLPADDKPTFLQRESLRAALASLRDESFAPGRVRLRRLEKKTWAEAWRRHFKPISIGTSLLIKPSWSRRQPKLGQAMVILDPGLAFGTGQHPTTEFCLRQLVRERADDTPLSVLDLGTGSGILAIAAASLGYRPVHALDNDPICIKVGRRNAASNGVAKQIRFQTVDLTNATFKVGRRYDLICANLIYDLLLSERKTILRLLESDGRLVLAGILSHQFAKIEAAYGKLGLCLVRKQRRKEWMSGIFKAR